MLLNFKRGQGSIVLRVKIRDSAAATGAGKTGLTSSSTGLIIATIADNEASATVYTQGGSTIESITTLGTFAAPTATKCRFKEVDATNHKGVYEIQIADARFAVSSAKSLLVSISGVTGAAECDALVPLLDVNPYDAVRGGMTALPNALAEAAGGLYTRGTGAGQINQDANGRVDVNDVAWKGATAPAMTGDAFARIGAPAGASVSADVAAVKVDTAAIKSKTDNLPSDPADESLIIAGTDAIMSRLGAPAGASVSADIAAVSGGGGGGGTDWDATERSQIRHRLGIDGTAAAPSATPSLASAAAVATVAGYVDTEVAAIKAKTDNLPSDPADASDVAAAFATVNATLATLAGYVDTEVAAIKAKTDNLPSDPADESLVIAATDAIMARLGAPAGASIAADIDGTATAADLAGVLAAYDAPSNTDLDAAVAGLATPAQVNTQVLAAIDAMLPDSVPADGTRPTLRQAMYMTIQFLLERTVSGTALTVRKPDGSTALMVLTLGDASSPTSITRVS